MSAKAIVPGALILALLGGWPARVGAQPPAPAAGAPAAEVLPTPPSPSIVALAPAGHTDVPPGSVVSPWIAYTKPGCCGPLGANGPIGSEFFVRSGVSIPVANGILSETLTTGWMTEVGGRALLFNQDTDAAWTGSVGLSYTYNNGNKADVQFTVSEGFEVTERVNPDDPFDFTTRQVTRFVDLPVTLRDYHRWSANVAFGREWFLFNPAYRPGLHLRFGVDNGGRWGYGYVGLNELTFGIDNVQYRRRGDVFGSYFIGVHSNLEVPICCGTRILVSGFRAEWDYTWTDILPGQAKDLQSVNLLLHVGLRY